MASENLHLFLFIVWDPGFLAFIRNRNLFTFNRQPGSQAVSDSVMPMVIVARIPFKDPHRP